MVKAIIHLRYVYRMSLLGLLRLLPTTVHPIIQIKLSEDTKILHHIELKHIYSSYQICAKCSDWHLFHCFKSSIVAALFLINYTFILSLPLSALVLLYLSKGKYIVSV